MIEDEINKLESLVNIINELQTFNKTADKALFEFIKQEIDDTRATLESEISGSLLACPNCRSEKLELDETSVKLNKNDITIEVICNECGNRYKEFGFLHNYISKEYEHLVGDAKNGRE